MKYDKIDILGVAGCVLAFILLIYFLPGQQRTLPPQTDLPSNEIEAVPETGVTAETMTQPGEGAEQLGEMVVAPGRASTSTLAGNLRKAWPETTAPMTTLTRQGEAEATVATDGGGITQVKLLQYAQDRPANGQQAEKVQMGSSDYPLLALVPETSSWNLDSPAQIVKQTEQELTLVRMIPEKNLQVQETWTAAETGSYEWQYTLQIANLGEQECALPGLHLEGGALPPSLSPGRKAGRGESAGGAAVGQTNQEGVLSFDLKALGKMNQEKVAQLATSPAQWAAVHSKYFLFAIWGKEQPLAGVQLAAVPALSELAEPSVAAGRYRMRVALSAPATIGAGETRVWQVAAYAGPKNYHRLHAMRNGLDSIMEMNRFFFFRPAWMGMLSRLLLDGMVWISHLFPASVGWGMGIICLTLLVKLLFWPLTHKSTVSMRKMQALQPQLKEMREKYKDDPSKLYRKQQELFKENKVSQLGGCMPMLLQIPVFFALFNTFRNAVELRQAGFLWAFDLSMPDTLAFSPAFLPIRPLALLMGATMYWQQKITPSPDPNQARMMNMMSLFFIFLFYGMPSALTLYMTVNYALGIIQTLVTRKITADKPNEVISLVK